MIKETMAHLDSVKLFVTVPQESAAPKKTEIVQKSSTFLKQFSSFLQGKIGLKNQVFDQILDHGLLPCCKCHGEGKIGSKQKICKNCDGSGSRPLTNKF